MITRRLALFRIAKASTVAAAVAAPPVIAVLQPKVAEDPALVRLGQKVMRLDTVCQHRKRAKEAARKAYDATAPELPAALLVTSYSEDFVQWERETDPDGEPVYPEGHFPQRRYHTSSYLAQELRSWVDVEGLDDEERGMELEIFEYLQDRLPIADRYERGIESALERSDYRKASGAHFLACHALEKLVGRIAKLSALTPEGITIKAQAYDAWIRSGDERARQFASISLGPGIAGDICRVLSEKDEA
ncbi:hypothetical protein ABIB06_004892 [Bradyrhizobium sp. LB8.2]|uniref:hypothetical protein n=1 Tax=Bradyrhizobium sp. LB8.2 TaxID=3156330 RepID=UPI00339345A5